MKVRTTLLALLTAVAAGACGDRGEIARPAGDPKPAPESAGGHVHGLGINPSDGALFVATHDGLFRVATGARAARIGTGHRDTMGFSVVGPDRFIASGHPDVQDLERGLPPFLGLMESRNAGRSWRSVSLLGRVDFHALEASGRSVYGSGGDWKTRAPRFLASEDGGRTWRERRAPEPLMSLAIDPSEQRRLLAAGSDGVYVSRDAGRTWRSRGGIAGLVAFARAGEEILVDVRGQVHRSEGAAGWERVGDVAGSPAALEAGPDGELYVALHDGTIKRSGDGGRSWSAFAMMRG